MEGKVKHRSDGHHDTTPGMEYVPSISAEKNCLGRLAAIWIDQKIDAWDGADQETDPNYSIQDNVIG